MLRFSIVAVALAAASPALAAPTAHELAEAAGAGDLATVRALVAAGVDLDGEDATGESTPLVRAVLFAREEVVRELLAAGAEVDVRDPMNGSTALMWAVRKGQTRRDVTTAPFDAKYGIAEALLAAGADPNARNRWQATALQWAADSGNARMAARLVAAGAQVDAADDSGLTPLMVAANYEGESFLAIVRLLLDAKAKPNLVDQNGQTALAKAASNHFTPDTVNLLVARGADPDLATHEGYTPLMFAAKNARSAVVAALLAAGADPARRTAAGETALDLARAAGFEETAALLAGAPPASP